MSITGIAALTVLVAALFITACVSPGASNGYGSSSSGGGGNGCQAGYCNSNGYCCPSGEVGCDGYCYASVGAAYSASGDASCLSVKTVC